MVQKRAGEEEADAERDSDPEGGLTGPAVQAAGQRDVAAAEGRGQLHPDRVGDRVQDLPDRTGQSPSSSKKNMTTPGPSVAPITTVMP